LDNPLDLCVLNSWNYRHEPLDLDLIFPFFRSIFLFNFYFVKIMCQVLSDTLKFAKWCLWFSWKNFSMPSYRILELQKLFSQCIVTY
jgi:hypothetical protein